MSDTREISIKTEKGTLCACLVNDGVYGEHPGISLYFKPKGTDYEIDIAMLSSKEALYDRDLDNLDLHVWADPNSDDWTNHFSIPVAEWIWE